MDEAAAVRDPDRDWFIDEPFCIDILLAHETFSGSVLDPCCGMGQILRGFARAGWAQSALHGQDVRDRTDTPGGWDGQVRLRDFLRQPLDRRADNIVMNPPYGGGELLRQFVAAARIVARAKVAALVNAWFLFPKGKAADFLREHPPLRIRALTVRASMPPGTKWAEGRLRAGNGRLDYAWLIWDNAPRQSPEPFVPGQTLLFWNGLPPGRPPLKLGHVDDWRQIEMFPPCAPAGASGGGPDPEPVKGEADGQTAA